MEIEFVGGYFDKKVLRSGSPELDAEKSRWLLIIVGAYIANMEKENKKPESYMTWRQPVPEVVALAKSQGWSAEERERRMRYHSYEVTSYEEAAGSVRFKAEYTGVE